MDRLHCLLRILCGKYLSLSNSLSNPLSISISILPLIEGQEYCNADELLWDFFFSISRCPVVYTIALCMSEMATFLPISSPFVRFAGRFVDPAFGVAAGYNFFLFQASLCKLIEKKRKVKGKERKGKGKEKKRKRKEKKTEKERRKKAIIERKTS